MTGEASVLVLDPQVALVQTPQPQRPKVDVPDPIRNLLQPHVFATHTIETFTQREFQRMPPLALTYRTSKRSGYSSGGSRSGIGRGDAT